MLERILCMLVFPFWSINIYLGKLLSAYLEKTELLVISQAVYGVTTKLSMIIPDDTPVSSYIDLYFHLSKIWSK